MELSVLGAVRVASAGATPLTLRGVPALLAGYLALHATGGRRVTRDRAAFALWPDRTESAARRSLNDAVYRLRRAAASVDGRLIDADVAELALAGHVDVDLDELRRALAEPEPDGWREAIRLYAGELLADVDTGWADTARREVSTSFQQLLADTWARRRHLGDHPGALDIARRWTAVAPFDEAAHRAVLSSLARLGDLAGALRHHDELVVRLAAELGAAPAAETTALADQLRAELDFASSQLRPRHETTFVGRAAERARLVSLVERCAAGDGGLAVVLGEPGMGKTRLLDEVAAAADWRGAAVSRVACGSDDSLAPGGPLVELLGDSTPPVRRAALGDLIDPVWLHQLDALAPLETRRGAPLDALGTAHEPVTLEAAATFHQVLGALQRLVPTVWLLDDLQWAGDDTWHLLDRLRVDLAGRVLVVATARRDELRRRDGPWALLGAWDRDGVPVVNLRPLPDEAIASLATEVIATGTPTPTAGPADVARIVAASGGNPLVAVALCTTPADDGGTRGPATLTEVVARKVTLLDDRAVAALEVAATIGDLVDYGLWRATADDPELPLHAATLERDELLVADERGYRFANTAMRAAVADGIETGRRRRLHRAVFAQLERREPDNVAALLAHAAAGGLLADEARCALEVGAQALAASDLALAARRFRQSLDALAAVADPAGADSADDSATRRSALRGLARALHVLADRDGERVALDELVRETAPLGGLEHATTLRGMAGWQLATGQFAAALETIEAAAALLDAAPAEAPGGPAVHAGLSFDRAAATRALGRMEESETNAAAALVAFRHVGDALGEASATDLLGGLAWARADFETAAGLHAAAAAIFERLGAPVDQARALNNLGSAHWGRGDHLAARHVHVRALALSRALGDRQAEGDNIDNLGGVAFVLGDHETAIERYQEALAIRRRSDDRWGVSISLSNLGDTYRARGEIDLALSSYAESLDVNRRAGVVRNETTTLQGQGLALVDAGRHADAAAILETVAARHAELGDHANLQETSAGLARAYLGLGNEQAAARTVAGMLARQRPDDRPLLRQVVHLCAAQCSRRRGDGSAGDHHLALAAAAMEDALAGLDVSDRERARARVPQHRETVAALTAASHCVAVRLAPAGAPRGQPVPDGDRVEVIWTLRRPGDPAAPAGDARRHVLRRLLDEASEQGAAPTDDELASALGVSRRTVLRDVNLLLSGPAGTARPPASTRGRVAAGSRHVTDGHRGGRRDDGTARAVGHRHRR